MLYCQILQVNMCHFANEDLVIYIEGILAVCYKTLVCFCHNPCCLHVKYFYCLNHNLVKTKSSLKNKL